jgi:hypothetical protein
VQQLFNDPKAFMVGTLFISIAVAFLIGWLGFCWFRFRQLELEAVLKQEMIQRGMSADDIVRVLKASKVEPIGACRKEAASMAAGVRD